MNPEQRERFERQAVLEAHATHLVRLTLNGADEQYVRHQLSLVSESVEAILALEKAQKVA